MSKQHNKKPGNIGCDSDIDDFFNLNDTEDSETSTNDEVYGKKTFILDVHGITKDTSTPKNQVTEVKVKKLKKKKKPKPHKAHGSESSDSISGNTSLAPTSVEESAKEEFYDAHESYHVLPESQLASPMAIGALALANSVHEQNLKDYESGPTPSPAQQSSIVQKEPSSAISKPVTSPK